MYTHFIHLSVDGHLRNLKVSAIVYNADRNMSVHISQVPVFSSFLCIPRSEITGSYENSMFNLLRSCHAVFLHGETTMVTALLKFTHFLNEENQDYRG